MEASRRWIQVLSRQDTRHWHSPFSAVLRNSRQSRIVQECEDAAKAKGCAEYVIFDADEILLTSGVIDG